ncbi:hypothetical protein BDV59DRAFT_202452 [Aspergillus ambiguus]|uniref:uncharacterized protein n=1 Tax=Aspergillus ambiguus TaxID=176160 RepID=UPI003CCCFB2E
MELHIDPNTLASIKDQVVLITGSSSGIGKATVDLCLQKGAKVIAGDLNPPKDAAPSEDGDGNFLFQQTDVTDWRSLRDLFIQGHTRFSRIDHVFANAGIGPRGNFLEETFDEDGLLAPPVLTTVQINLLSVINTVRLAVHYLSKDGAGSNSPVRSIVLSASASSIQNFATADYTTAKHGVLGILRGLTDDLEQSTAPTAVRLNAVAPSWTATGLVPREVIESMGAVVQEPEAVAKGVVTLFGEPARHGELLYIWDSRYFEINKAEGGLLDSTLKMLPVPVAEDEIMRRLKKAVAGS